jgi:hypothetical protein
VVEMWRVQGGTNLQPMNDRIRVGMRGQSTTGGGPGLAPYARACERHFAREETAW